MLLPSSCSFWWGSGSSSSDQCELTDHDAFSFPPCLGPAAGESWRGQGSKCAVLIDSGEGDSAEKSSPTCGGVCREGEETVKQYCSMYKYEEVHTFPHVRGQSLNLHIRSNMTGYALMFSMLSRHCWQHLVLIKSKNRPLPIRKNILRGITGANWEA